MKCLVCTCTYSSEYEPVIYKGQKGDACWRCADQIQYDCLRKCVICNTMKTAPDRRIDGKLRPVCGHCFNHCEVSDCDRHGEIKINEEWWCEEHLEKYYGSLWRKIPQLTFAHRLIEEEEKYKATQTEEDYYPRLDRNNCSEWVGKLWGMDE